MGVSRQQVIQTAEKLVARGRLQAAISEYRKVLESAPNDTSMLNRVGDLYARLNQVDKATRLFRQTAENFARQGFFVKAIAIYKKIIRLDPSQIAAYESLAGLYARQGLANEAIGQYQVVADYYLKHDDRVSAVAIYRHMIEVDAENPRYRLRLAGLLQSSGDASGALEQYHEIAGLMLAHGRSEEAAQVYTSALDVDSSDTGFLVRAVSALREAGHPAGAARVLALVAERDAETAAAVRAELARTASREEEAAADERSAAEAGRPFWMAEEGAGEAAPSSEREEEPAEVLDVLDEVAGDDEGLVLDLDALALEGGEIDTVADVRAAAGEALTEEAVDFEFELEIEEAESTAEPVGEEEAAAEVAEVAAGTAAEEPGGGEELELELEEEEAAAAPEVGGAIGEAAGALAEAETVAPAVAEDEEAAIAEAAVEEAVEQAAVEEEVGEEAVVEEGVVEEAPPPAGPPGPEVPDARPTEIAERADALLLEATVLSKYGMDEMAAACLEEVLELDPDHVETQGRLIHLQISLGRRDEALIMANRFAGLVAEGGEPAIWEQVVARMGEQGFELAEGRFVATGIPAAEVPEAEEEEVAFEQPADWAAGVERAVASEARAAETEVTPAADPAAEVVESDTRAEVAGAEPVAAHESAAATDEAVRPDVAAAAEVPPAEEPAAEALAADERHGAVEIDTRRDLLDIATAVRRRPAAGGRPGPVTPGELLAGADELAGEGEEVAAEPTPPLASEAETPAEAATSAAAGGMPPDLDLAAMAEELEAAAERFAASLGPAVQPSEPATATPEEPAQAAPAATGWSDGKALGVDEFFDLATELEAELLEAELEDDLLPPVQEQTIEEIVEGFRRGMEKSLAPEDYDTHYNLGIAYQEMGLVDEAIGEFQLAAKDPRYLVECCSLLAGCFQSKGYPELAVQWYERGLASPSAREDERLGLLYELGNLELAIGERERARDRFVELYGISSTYRDVVAKLEELGRRPS